MVAEKNKQKKIYKISRFYLMLFLSDVKFIVLYFNIITFFIYNMPYSSGSEWPYGLQGTSWDD